MVMDANKSLFQSCGVCFICIMGTVPNQKPGQSDMGFLSWILSMAPNIHHNVDGEVAYAAN